MTQFIQFTIILISAIILNGCKREYSYEGGFIPSSGNGKDTIVKSQWRFSTANTTYNGPVDTAYLTNEGLFQVLTLSGKSSDNNEIILIKLKTTDAYFQKGKTYKTFADEVKFIYKNHNDTIFSAILYKGGDLYFTISEMDSNKIIATFEGQALTKNITSESITEGFISSPIKKGIESNTGYAMLWATTLCNNAFMVKVNNLPGKIDQTYYSVPDCGEPGTATYNLPPGEYPWVAYCGRDSITGKISVKSGVCSKVLIDFPYMPPPVTTTTVNCKLKEVTYNSTLLNNQSGYNQIIAEFSDQSVTTLQYYVTPVPRIFTHQVSYAGDTIFIDVDNDLKKYFIVDSKKRVIEYNGFYDPALYYPREPILIKYFYDNENQLIRRDVLDPRYHYLISSMIFNWQEGNIVSTNTILKFTGQSTRVDFEYYTKEGKSIPFTNMDAFELTFFQPLISFGKPCKNLIKNKIIQTLNKPVIFNYDRYIIDTNGYVLSCRFFSDSKETLYTFTYDCF